MTSKPLKKNIILGRSGHLNLFFQTEDEGDKIHRNDRTTIKQRIVGLMLKSPDQIQKQVSPFLHSSVTETISQAVKYIYNLHMSWRNELFSP